MRLPNWRPGWWPGPPDHSPPPPPPLRLPLGAALAVGSGRAAGAGIAPKAAMLDRAAAAGLAVPAGIILADGDAGPQPNDVVSWAAEVGVAALAVRSAFGAEDSATTSLAGWFDSFLGVEPAAVPDAVARVRRSADRRDGRFRRDVLVMAMVDAEHAGVAFSEPGTYDDLVNVVDGLADRLVAGQEAGDRVELSRLGRVGPGWQGRLQRLLRAARTEFGDRPWDVEWADDGRVCWLVQLRPITAPPLRNETLTAANHAEILPSLPSTLMTSVIEEAGPDLFAWYRRRVPGLPAERDFLYVKSGRPMINLSLLEDMMRHLGLPTALVAESIGGGSGRSAGLDPGRLVRSTPSLIRLGLAQVVAVARSGRNRRAVAAIGTPAATTFSDVVDDLHRAYVALVTGMFPLSSAIGPPLGLLRAAGTLYEHAGRHRTVTTELAERLIALRVGRDSSALDRFLTEFGHRGIYESDIARPRYHEDPLGLVAAVHAVRAEDAVGGSSADGRGDPPGPTERRPPPRTLRGLVTWPIWALAAQPMSARELFRHDAMRAFDSVRQAALALAADAVGRGQLREVDDLWLLRAPEVRRLDTGWRPPPGFWSDREAERAALAAVDVPHVIGRHDPLPATASIDPTGRLVGVPLTAGVVTGTARVLDEPAPLAAAGREDHREVAGGVVVVARSIDAGWITTLAGTDAVVVEIGGDLSHGSILVRELGLPAVTNVSGVTGVVTDGDLVRVDGAAGTVEVLERARESG
ncbi:MAG: PEP-utilizing enzyme [Actinomycetota bacterium]